MAERHGVALWPGVVSVLSCTYTTSHGTTPGCAVLTILPQPISGIQMQGTLKITDGTGLIILQGCRVDGIRANEDGDGVTWTLEIVDRRWRWRELGQISGCYNQRDPRGQLLPWTLKSVKDLISLCLTAMGESDFELNLPTAATSTDAIYPAVDWNAVNPAYALMQLVEA